MKSELFDWDKIFEESSNIIVDSLANDKTPVSSASELYRLLKKKNAQKHMFDKLPEEVTYRKKLHTYLNIPKEQRIRKTALYQLVGQYKKMSLTALANYIVRNANMEQSDICYLFYRVRKCDRTISENRRILYQLSTELKKNFEKEIVYLSYDDDTIVIMCPNPNAKQKIIDKINNLISVEDTADDQEENQ